MVADSVTYLWSHIGKIWGKWITLLCSKHNCVSNLALTFHRIVEGLSCSIINHIVSVTLGIMGLIEPAVEAILFEVGLV